MTVVSLASPAQIRAEIEDWIDLLVESVDEGAGLGFLPGLPRAEAAAYFERVAQEVAAGTRVVLVAHVAGALAGSAQLDLCMRPNGLHRAECQKVMVRAKHRRGGVGRAVMVRLDEEAAARGRTTLYLDTFASQAARRFYETLDWTHAGDIPRFSVMADGSLGTTSLYYKLIEG